MFNTNVNLFVFLLLAGVVCGTVVNTNECKDSNDEICEILEVRIDPCEEQPCQFEAGSSPTVEFDFIPKFNAEKLETLAYGALGDIAAIGMPNMDQDGCKNGNPCPVKSGEKYTFKNNIPLNPNFPKMAYKILYKIWDSADVKNVCCFSFKGKLV